jgi:hypothetical protein
MPSPRTHADVDAINGAVEQAGKARALVETTTRLNVELCLDASTFLHMTQPRAQITSKKRKSPAEIGPHYFFPALINSRNTEFYGLLSRRLKTRCDSGKPACGYCVRQYKECVYAHTQKRGGGKRVADARPFRVALNTARNPYKANSAPLVTEDVPGIRPPSLQTHSSSRREYQHTGILPPGIGQEIISGSEQTDYPPANILCRTGTSSRKDLESKSEHLYLARLMAPYQLNPNPLSGRVFLILHQP